MKTVRLTALLLLTVMLLSLLPSCAFFEDETVALYAGDTEITEGMYAYIRSAAKYRFVATYKNEGLRDTAMGWSSLSNDGERTWRERFEYELEDYTVRLLTAAYLFDTYYGFSLSEYDESAIEASIALMVLDMGSEDALEDALKETAHCTVKDVRRVAILNAKANALFEELYGADGTGVHASILEARYQASYVRIKTVFIRQMGKLIGEGDVHEEFTPEQEEEALRRISILEAALDSGEMTEARFLTLQAEYNEDKTTADAYPNGFYFSKDASYDRAVIDVALDMQVGETRLVTGEYGTYLVRRYENEVGGYAMTANEDWFVSFAYGVAQEEFAKLIEEKKDAVLFAEGIEVTDVRDVEFDYRLILR